MKGRKFNVKGRLVASSLLLCILVLFNITNIFAKEVHKVKSIDPRVIGVLMYNSNYGDYLKSLMVEDPLYFTNARKNNPVFVTTKKVKVSYKKLKRKKVKLTLKKYLYITNMKGVPLFVIDGYEINKNTKEVAFTIDKNLGTLSISKKLPKGLYKVPLKVFVSGDKSYEGANISVIVKVKVK